VNTPLPDPATLHAAPLIVLPGLEGRPEAGYTALQEWLLPFSDAIQMAWWACFALTLCVLVARFFVKPLLSRKPQ